MASDRDEDPAEGIDWGEFSAEATHLDEIAPLEDAEEERRPTPSRGLTLPGGYPGPGVRQAVPARAWDETTGPNDVSKIPGYEFGLAEGRRQGRARGIDEALTAFRLTLIQGRTDPGTAHLMEEKIRRWMREPINQELIRVMLDAA